VSTPPKPVPDVLKVLGASSTKNVLIVEGPTDRAVCEKWLQKLAAPSLFSSKVEVVDGGGRGEGGGRSVVLTALEWFRDRGGNPARVFGLVDRDAWDQRTIVHWMTSLSQLRINADRHTLENYFCDPDEVVSALLNINATWAPQGAALRAQIESHRQDYVDHWALLTTTDRLKNRMVQEGYPGYFANAIPIPSDSDIQARFHQWTSVVDAAVAFTVFDQLRQGARTAAPNQAYRSHVWGKLFYNQVVYAAPSGLQSLLGKPGEDWMIDLAEWSSQVPADITVILRPLLV
jgi:hypothetical protein